MGEDSSVSRLTFDYVADGAAIFPQVEVAEPPKGRSIPKNQLKVLKSFTGKRGTPNVFRGARIAVSDQQRTRNQSATEHIPDLPMASPTHLHPYLLAQNGASRRTAYRDSVLLYVVNCSIQAGVFYSLTRF